VPSAKETISGSPPKAGASQVVSMLVALLVTPSLSLLHSLWPLIYPTKLPQESSLRTGSTLPTLLSEVLPVKSLLSPSISSSMNVMPIGELLALTWETCTLANTLPAQNEPNVNHSGVSPLDKFSTSLAPFSVDVLLEILENFILAFDTSTENSSMERDHGKLLTLSSKDAELHSLLVPLPLEPLFPSPLDV